MFQPGNKAPATLYQDSRQLGEREVVAFLSEPEGKKSCFKRRSAYRNFCRMAGSDLPGIGNYCVDGQGNNKTVFLETPGKEIKINDFSGDYILYRSLSLQEDTAIDYFYSEPDRFIIN